MRQRWHVLVLGRAIVFALVMSVSIRPVLAAGVTLREGSADWTANAFAGATAKAYDASTAASNPAGMTRLDWNETDLSFSLIAPSSSFSGSNTFGTGQVTSGSQGGNALEPIVLPSAFGVWNFSRDLKFGLTLSSPFGQRIAYSEDFVGRFKASFQASRRCRFRSPLRTG